ncbi:MAG: S4 domain-containing protein [Candidatus Eisenbacteria bacterium]
MHSSEDGSARAALRVDLLLDRLCLAKTRSQAAKACAEGRVFVNGMAARASKEVRVGDRLRLIERFGAGELEVLLLEVPQKAVAKAAARECYEVISRTSAPRAAGFERDPEEGKSG